MIVSGLKYVAVAGDPLADRRGRTLRTVLSGVPSPDLLEAEDLVAGAVDGNVTDARFVALRCSLNCDAVESRGRFRFTTLAGVRCTVATAFGLVRLCNTVTRAEELPRDAQQVEADIREALKM